MCWRCNSIRVEFKPICGPCLQLFGRLRSQTKIVLYFRRPVTRSVKLLGTNRRFLRLRNSRHCTEVLSMAEQHQSTLGLPCHVVPCPHARQLNRKRVADPKRPCLGLVLGQPRQAKGFDVFVDALEHLAGPLQQGQLRLTLQSLPNDQVEPSLQPCVARLSVFTRDCPHATASGTLRE
jgi:hypothetical protein